MTELVVALGLLLVIEGLLYAVMPDTAKAMMRHVLETSDVTLRRLGVAALASGVFLVWLVKG
jgi:hypothetical protein